MNSVEIDQVLLQLRLFSMADVLETRRQQVEARVLGQPAEPQDVDIVLAIGVMQESHQAQVRLCASGNQAEKRTTQLDTRARIDVRSWEAGPEASFPLCTVVVRVCGWLP